MIELRITDAAALEALEPAQATACLITRGWAVSRQDKKVCLRLLADQLDYEVLQPLSHQLRDCPSRVSEILNILALFENRAGLEVYHEIGGSIVGICSPASTPPATTRNHP